MTRGTEAFLRIFCRKNWCGSRKNQSGWSSLEKKLYQKKFSVLLTFQMHPNEP